MGVTTTNNKPINPRGNDQSPKGYNRAALYSGKALDFDGVNDQITGTASVLPTGANPFTTCFYYKETTTSKEAFSWGTMSTNQANGYRTATNKFKHFFYANDLESTIETPVGTWVFAAVTFDGTTRSIYINGQLDISDTPTGVQVTGTNYKVGLATSSYWDGNISNVRVFNTALTAAQVADLYNNPEKVVPTGLESNLKLWLPMMEGAGTTAYDGSGNGNHGTISGATYVNGIGAPSPQSAVMDWNKGSNILDNSENFDAWLKNAGNTITSNSIAAPDGLTTADTISSPVSSQINQHQVVSPLTSGADYVFSVWLKKKTTSEIQIYQYSTATPIGFVSRATINFDSGTITDVEGSGATIEEYTNGWFRCAIYCTAPSTSLSHGIYTAAAGVADVYAWGGQSEQSDTLGPYVRTGATAQTSEVLLPQGLTTGRDITGVNLFENVRKQGALNLDGNSWAEVHDNESLDMGTGSLTLEAWVYSSASDPTSGEGIISKWHEGSNKRSYLMYALDFDSFYFFVSNNGTASNNVTFGINSVDYEKYNHFVCTFDGTNLKAYVNGALYNTSAATFTGIYNSDENVAIAKYNLGQGQPREYSNSIAQPRIYNRALTAEEVQRNYNAGKNTYTN